MLEYKTNINELWEFEITLHFRNLYVHFTDLEDKL